MAYLINKVLQIMLNENLITTEEVEVYEYGLYLMILKFVHICSALFFSVLIGREEEVVLFMCGYSMIRKYAGGYHTKKAISCFVISVVIVFILHLTIDKIPIFMQVVTALCSTITICYLSPIASINKPLEDEQIIKNRRIAQLISNLLFVVCSSSYILDVTMITRTTAYSLFFCAFFMLIALVMSE